MEFLKSDHYVDLSAPIETKVLDCEYPQLQETIKAILRTTSLKVDPMDPEVTEEDIMRANPNEYYKEVLGVTSGNQKPALQQQDSDDQDCWDDGGSQQNIMNFMEDT